MAFRIVFAGGGTGGHVYLAVALARELLRREPSADVLFVGTQRGLESRIVPEEGFRLETIVSRGLKGMKALAVARSLLLVPGSLLQSRRILGRHRPDVVVGVGGYASGPVVLAAWWMGKPTLIMEPNAYPGLTNRWLGRLVDAVALAMPDTGNFFRGRATVTGIPVREEFASLPERQRTPGRLTVLIYGGSQGSHALNTIVCEALPDLKEFGSAIRLIHQTGELELEQVRSAYREASVDGEIRPFLPRIYEQLAEADVVFARAGAGTVAELTVAGRASILVPFPGAADDHQRKNARALESHGAAKMIEESEFQPGRLARELRRLLENEGEIERMEEAARKLGRPGAAARITDMIVELAGRRDN